MTVLRHIRYPAIVPLSSVELAHARSICERATGVAVRPDGALGGTVSELTYVETEKESVTPKAGTGDSVKNKHTVRTRHTKRKTLCMNFFLRKMFSSIIIE